MRGLLVVLPVLTAVALAQVDDPRAREARHRLQQQVEGFLRDIGRSGRYELPQLEQALARWEELLRLEAKGIGAPGEQRQALRSFVDQTLRELEPAYAHGAAALEEGKAASAAAGLLRLLREDYPATHLEGYATLRLGQALLDLEQYGEAREHLTRVVEIHGPYLPHRAEALFELGRCQEALGLRSAARASFETVLEEHGLDAPETLLRASRAALAKLQDAVTGPLAEVVSRMADSGSRLQKQDTGDATQAVQQEILDLLDRLIEEAEQNESGGSGSGAAQARQSSSPAGQSAAQGAAQAAPVLGAGPGELEREAWGQLPEREREEVLQQLRERFPARYQDLLEQYYRSIREPGER